MAEYLLITEERVGDRYYTVNRSTVKATTHGYAKYHWHKHMNQMGCVKESKHEYVNWDMGWSAELIEVRELDESDEGDLALLDEFASIEGFAEL
jgi:hypothetical protein